MKVRIFIIIVFVAFPIWIVTLACASPDEPILDEPILETGEQNTLNCPIHFGASRVQATIGQEVRYEARYDLSADRECEDISGRLFIESENEFDVYRFGDRSSNVRQVETENGTKYVFEASVEFLTVLEQIAVLITNDVPGSTITALFQPSQFADEGLAIPTVTEVYSSEEVVERFGVSAQHVTEVSSSSDVYDHTITILNESRFLLRDTTIFVDIPLSDSDAVGFLDSRVEIGASNLVSGEKVAIDNSPPPTDQPLSYYGIVFESMTVYADTNVFPDCNQGCPIETFNIFQEHIPLGNLEQSQVIRITFQTQILTVPASTPSP